MSKRVAVVADAGTYVGPPLARLLAARGHDLVLGDAPPELVDELAAAGAEVATVDGVRELADDGAAEALVAAAVDRFGRIDAASAFSGRIVVGRFLRSSRGHLGGFAGFLHRRGKLSELIQQARHLLKELLHLHCLAQ